jgi:hypothetical protein
VYIFFRPLTFFDPLYLWQLLKRRKSVAKKMHLFHVKLKNISILRTVWLASIVKDRFMLRELRLWQQLSIWLSIQPNALLFGNSLYKFSWDGMMDDNTYLRIFHILFDLLVALICYNMLLKRKQVWHETLNSKMCYFKFRCISSEKKCIANETECFALSISQFFVFFLLRLKY